MKHFNLFLAIALLTAGAIAAEITIPDAATSAKLQADRASGSASLNYQQYYKIDVPSGTNIAALAISVDDPANFAAIMAAIKAIEGVNTAVLTAHGTVPAVAPIGVHGEGHWEFHNTAGLRGYTASPPTPE